MYKCFCNKCGVELGKNEKKHRVQVRLYGYGSEGNFTAEYCKQCLTDIIGVEQMNEIEESKAEKRRKMEQRKAERLARESNDD